MSQRQIIADIERNYIEAIERVTTLAELRALQVGSRDVYRRLLRATNTKDERP